MNPEDFQSYVASGRLTQSQVNKLTSLDGNYCTHKSWGFGKVSAFDLVLGQVTIDFDGKSGHTMQLAYAAESLIVLPSTHILAQKHADLEGLKKRAASEPAEIIRAYAVSFGEAAITERLETVLSGPVIPKTEWSKWLTSAKRACKKDGRITWPTKKNDPIRVLEKPVTAADTLRDQLASVRSFPQLLEVAEDALKKIGKSSDIKTLIPELIKALDEHIAANSERNPSLVLEAIWIRDDLTKFSEGTSANSVNVQSLVQEVHSVHELVNKLSTNRQKHILPVIKQSFPDWENRIKALVPVSGGRLLTEIVDFLTREGKGGELQEIFQRYLRECRAGADMIIWLCKNRENSEYAAWLPSLINGRFLYSILNFVESSALESGSRRKNPVTELLLSDATLIADLVGKCDPEETRDLGKSLLANPAIEELDKRSLMARLIKICPSVQTLLVSNQQARTESLIVSWESLERRKQEYEEIINKKIPENSKEIGIARSYGDLRENHEFKAAKEMQTVLMRQKADLEDMLARARGSDFYKPDTSVVNIGTLVTLQPLDGGPEISYSILGAWDTDPTRNILSYQAAFAKALLGKKAGEEAVLPGDKGERKMKVISITAAFPDGMGTPSSSDASPAPSQTVHA